MWRVYDDVTAVEAAQLKRHVNNPAHSIAVLNCSGNANRPELSRTVPYRDVPNRTVPCSGKAPLVRPAGAAHPVVCVDPNAPV